ncbi:MAG: P-loop NTPase [Thermacetogeniaceae bacterium]
MLCLIAAERESAERIKYELERSGFYPGWNFMICDSYQELEKWAYRDVDVLVVSRFLPGADPIDVLKNLRAMFSGAHIVLLAGTAGERQAAYIRAAHKHGFYNIVTGKLPGDRPYTIFTALKVSREPEGDGFLLDCGGEEDEERDEWEEDAARDEPDAGSNPGDVKAALEDILSREISGGEITAIKSKLQEIIAMLDAEPAISLSPSGRRQRGVVVYSVANKGGVGKTTVAITLAMALSRAGVPTVLADFDFGGPDVTNFFGIKDVPGIEALAGRPVRRNLIEDLIVQKNGVYILPGPTNKTMPNFKRGQLLEIVNVLAEMFPVVIGDTPAEYWTKPWLAELFARADRVLAVVDQSVFSENDTRKYAPYLLSMGVTPEKISIVLNRYSPKLHNPKKVEKAFCAGFKKEVKNLPRIVAVIPEDWNAHVLKGYKGEVAGLDEGQWHRLAEEIARMAGYEYRRKEERKSPWETLFSVLKKS